MKKTIKLFFSPDGPGDVIQTFREWENGRDDNNGDVSVPFSAQFYDICKFFGAKSYTISPNNRKEIIHETEFIVEHRPKPKMRERGGVFYYLGELWHDLGLICTCIGFRSQIAIVGDCSIWPVWVLARIVGIRIVVILHCTLWPTGFRPRKFSDRVLQKMTGWFFSICVDGVVGVSPECVKQVYILSPKMKVPVVVGLSLFRKHLFDPIQELPKARTPFHVLFAGRIEKNKGVFDLLHCAKILERENAGSFIWDVCGSGSVLEELRQAVCGTGLEKVYIIHGRLSQEKMLARYAESHIVVVPTTSSFAEGLNQVAIEAILAGRPLVTSRVCPALDLVSDAAIEVPPDDVDAYAEAVKLLYNNDKLFEEKRRSCRLLAAPFFDLEPSWGVQLRKIIERLVLS